MTHASLFSGIGGPDLAAEWMGWENIFHCEINPFGQNILKHYWPNSTSYENIITTDFSIHRGTVDVLTGGFPCQPYSLAGLRKVKEDERHLWPDMLRAIREVKPRWVVGENVLGLVGWNDGLVFEEVQADLEAEGYEVQPYILPAASVDAPHRRDRVWFVAYATGSGRKERQQDRRWENTEKNRTGMELRNKRSSSDEHVANSDCPRLESAGYSGCIRREVGEKIASINRRSEAHTWRAWPTQPPVCDGNDGLSSRLDGITFSKWRTESIKAGGNAIVPQVIHQIFKAIEQYELQLA